jgi:integrase
MRKGIVEKRPLWPSQKEDQLGDDGDLARLKRLVARLAADCAARELAPADTTPHDLRHTFSCDKDGQPINDGKSEAIKGCPPPIF